jgi:hypothetical protein
MAPANEPLLSDLKKGEGRLEILRGSKEPFEVGQSSMFDDHFIAFNPICCTRVARVLLVVL